MSIRKFSVIHPMALAVLGMTALSARADVTIVGDVTPPNHGNAWTSDTDVVIGNNPNQSGSVLLDVGAVVTTQNTSLGQYAGSDGTLTVNGTGSTWTMLGNLVVGNYGTGTLNITNGGTVINTNGYLGSNGGSSGNVTVDGVNSSWQITNNLAVGDLGAGVLDIRNGGTVSYGGGLSVGVDKQGDVSGDGALRIHSGSTLTGTGTNNAELGVNAAGSAEVAGTWTMQGALTVGESNVGSLKIINGGKVSNADSYIGYNSMGSGTVTVQGHGSEWQVEGNLIVGYYGTGTLEITHGGKVNSAAGYLGYAGGSTGTVTVQGHGSEWTMTGDLIVGDVSTASLNIINGGTVNNANSYLGYTYGGGAGAVTVDGRGSTWTMTGSLIVGYGGGGTSTVNITHGGKVNSADGYLGGYSSTEAVGTVTVSGRGSEWALTGNLTVGDSGKGVLNITHGGLVTSDTVTLAEYGTANLTLNGGTLSARQINCGYGQVSLNILNGGVLDVQKIIVGGQLDVSGVQDGFQVHQNQIIGGTGKIIGDVTFLEYSHLAPGNSIGTLTGENVTFENGSVLDFEFGSMGHSDMLAVDGTLTLPETGKITLNLIDNAEANGLGSIGEGSYTLFTFNTLNFYGNLNDEFAIGDTPAGFELSSMNYMFSVKDNTILLTIGSPLATPEPASLMLLGLGGLAMFYRRRSH
ncbi:MAG: PEP-CTERM sorting domain-containing protein [Phycisphaerales bacterium]|nr:PEP-CTERM sorting domain-containing protein [Phycisphaerales bacterium]